MGVGEIAVRVGYIWPPPFTGIKPDQNWIYSQHIIKYCNKYKTIG